MNHKYIYSARAREVAAKKFEWFSFANKALFLLVMLAIVFFATESKASWDSNNFHHASVESLALASGVYAASYYVHHRYRKHRGYRHLYRPRSHYNYSRYRGRLYNRHYYKRHYNRYGYGNKYRYRRHY